MRSFDIQLRWGDFDRLGHLNNVAFIRCAETARMKLLALVPLHVDFVLVRQDFQYLVPVGPDVVSLEVGVEVSAIGRSSVTLSYEMKSASSAHAHGTSVLVCWSSAEGRSAPLPSSARRWLGREMSSHAGGGPAHT